ncbi:hypothetical protein JXA80_06280 [bacterium]|nr:hypothetical protein [candidate division CSSED10-310 bacterium]
MKWIFRFSVVVTGMVGVTLLMMHPVSAQPSWHLDTLVASHDFTAMGPDSQCMAPDGYPALAYGGNGLFYARNNGTYWELETVDASPNVGMFTCLKFDAQGNAHIVYSDWDIDWIGMGVKYARQVDGAWQVASVPLQTNNIGSFSLDLDANGLPWIAYVDNTDFTVGTIHPDGSGGWDRDVIFLSMVPLWNIEVVMDGMNPIITYFAGATDPKLKLAYNGTSGWETLELDPSPTSVTHLDMALDTSGFVHICYKTMIPDALKYITLEPGGWPSISEIVDDTGTENGQYPSIVLHPISGDPVISYVNGNGPTSLKTAQNEGLGWEIQTVRMSSRHIRYPSITETVVGHQHITFYDDEDQTLNHAFVVSGSPSFTAMDRIRKVYIPLEAGSNPAGDLFVLFTDYFDMSLYLQTRRSGEWRASTIPGIDEPVTALSSDVSAQGYLGMARTASSVQTLTTGYMTFSEQSDTGWRHQTVDMDQSAAGIRTCTRFDAEGIPHILYDASTVTLLRHAWRPESTWIISDIYDNWMMYYFMDIDPAGRVHVIFQDASFGLHYAQSETMSDWSDEIIDTDSVQGGSSIIRVDAGGRPHVLHMDPDTNTIRYFVNNGSQWSNETIPGTAFYDTMVWDYAISPSGRHDLILWNDVTMHLHHFWKASDTAQWETQVIDTRDLQVWDIALIMDPLSRLEIVYYDVIRGSVFHGVLRQPVWYDLSMRVTRMLPGTEFQLVREIHNTTASEISVDEYLLLDVYGAYWFAPGWTPDVEVIFTGADAGDTDLEIPLEFTWPSVTGSATGIRFWGGIVTTGTSQLLDYDLATFEWDE